MSSLYIRVCGCLCVFVRAYALRIVSLDMILMVYLLPLFISVFVSRFGLAVRRGKQPKDLGSIPLRLSFLFESSDLWTLSCDPVLQINETLKRLSSLPILGIHLVLDIISLSRPGIVSVPASISSETTRRWTSLTYLLSIPVYNDRHVHLVVW